MQSVFKVNGLARIELFHRIFYKVEFRHSPALHQPENRQHTEEALHEKCDVRDITNIISSVWQTRIDL